MNFILFSGPPRSGKDTAAKIAWEFCTVPAGRMAHWEKFSFPNKRAFAGMMGVPCDNWGYVRGYEEAKDAVIPSLGVSYRQWQIDYSERFMKPLYGENVFGRLLLSRCSDYASGVGGAFEVIHIVSDCGFQVEVDYLAPYRVLFFDMHRPGTDYVGDSRQRVKPHSSWTTHHVSNHSSIQVLQEGIEAEVRKWLRS